MINDKKVIAIIPARAGSKRVKDKNTRPLKGEPLIYWTIEAAKSSKYIDDIYVSTDSEKIQKIAIDNNVDANPLRPEALASDNATSVDVVIDALDKKGNYEVLVLLQPTSPLRKAKHVDEALEMFIEKEANSVTSVCEAEVHPSWCAPIDENSSIEQLINKIKIKRSQDLEINYRLNGAIYINDVTYFIKNKSFFAKEKAFAYKMNKVDSVDIDTEEDLEIAQKLI